MEFEWDEANIEHIARHNVAPIEAEEAVSDPQRRAVPTYSKDGEQRLLVTGATNEGRMLTVIITLRRECIRTVTARPASRRERINYQEAQHE